MEKDIIIGAAINYNHNDLNNFVTSLRKYYLGKILFFVSNNIDKNTISFFDKYKVSYFKLGEASNTIFKTRYKIYSKYLKKNKFSRIMISDTRDVIFQKNPFTNKKFSSLCFFSEDKSIGECTFNSSWIKNLYGKKKFNKFKHKKILCSGTTIGKYKNIINYLNKINREIEITNNTKIAKQLKKDKSLKILIGKISKFILGKRIYSYLNHKIFKGYTYVGTDQGNHNYLIYSKKIKNFKIYSNKDGYVCTLGNANVRNFKVDNGLYNSLGLKFSVVHQYDRIYKKNSYNYNTTFKKKFIKYLKAEFK